MGRQEESLWGVVVALVLSQVLSAGYRIVTQFVSVPELHPLVLRLYGDAVALVVLFPAALIFDRYVIRAQKQPLFLPQIWQDISFLCCF